ncbi:hypothetical protein AB6A40_009934 [Gnathostoma spinigerum]|uniref:W2 domain-containing protein n=1 Tax=Gnathostoma spinigerum TaxID=75299 RepID=A0ABD6ETC6_9BILA
MQTLLDLMLNNLSNAIACLQHVKESMERLRDHPSCNNQLVKNLILEINSSKLAYNITMEEVALHLFRAFLSLDFQSSSALIGVATNWKSLFINYYKPIQNQTQALIAIEEYLNVNPEFGPMTAKVIYSLYEMDIFDEEAILKWFSTVSETAPVRSLVMPIIHWLEEADEEEDD